MRNRKRITYLNVTPYAGVWIEIGKAILSVGFIRVTPYAGVWNEIR